MKNKQRKTYRLVDKYEGTLTVIYESDDINEITKEARRYDVEDVDGECYLEVYKLVGTFQYIRVNEWTY